MTEYYLPSLFRPGLYGVRRSEYGLQSRNSRGSLSCIEPLQRLQLSCVVLSVILVLPFKNFIWALPFSLNAQIFTSACIRLVMSASVAQFAYRTLVPVNHPWRWSFLHALFFEFLEQDIIRIRYFFFYYAYENNAGNTCKPHLTTLFISPYAVKYGTHNYWSLAYLRLSACMHLQGNLVALVDVATA